MPSTPAPVEVSAVNTYERSHLSDSTLLQSLATHLARERTATGELLADLAEVDARKLYLPAAYPSLFAYCVGELHMSEDAAYKRIQAARAARATWAVHEPQSRERVMSAERRARTPVATESCR